MTGRELNIIHLFTRGHKKALLSHIEHKALTSAQQRCNTFQYPINFCSSKTDFYSGTVTGIWARKSSWLPARIWRESRWWGLTPRDTWLMTVTSRHVTQNIMRLTWFWQGGPGVWQARRRRWRPAVQTGVRGAAQEEIVERRMCLSLGCKKY